MKITNKFHSMRTQVNKKMRHVGGYVGLPQGLGLAPRGVVLHITNPYHHTLRFGQRLWILNGALVCVCGGGGRREGAGQARRGRASRTKTSPN